jgi:FkbM family methyltransferase
VEKKFYEKLALIRNSWRKGLITRESYWDAMQLNHLILREYHELLKNSDVESIQIDSKSLIIKLHNGARFYWDPEEVRGSANVIVNDGKIEAGYSEIIISASENKNNVFDVGANVGYYAVHFAKKMADRGGHVHAFEPIKNTYERLKENIKLNNLESFITINNNGLSNENCIADFYQPGYSGSVASSMHNLHPEESVKISQARVETLDSYCRKKDIRSIDIMKIDVEGAEMLVIQGGMNIIKECCPILFMELLRKWSMAFGYHPNDLLKILYEFGYKCWTQDNAGLVPFEWMNESTIQTNFILVQEQLHGKPNQW